MLSKIRVTVALGLGVFAGLSAIVSDPAAAVDPVLSCRGGGHMTFDIRTVGTHARLEVVMFKAPTTTAGPGQCAWLDRPLNASEPTRLHIDEPGSLQANCNAQAKCNFGIAPKDTLAIINAIVSSGPFLVHVHNNNAGYLEISHVGP